MSKSCIIYPTVAKQLINQYKNYEDIIKSSYIYLSVIKPDFSINDLLTEINETLTSENLEIIKIPSITSLTAYEYNLAVNAFSFAILRTFYKDFENFNFPEIEGIDNNYIENLLDQFIVKLDEGDNEILKENRQILKEEILKDRNAFKLRAINVIKDLRLVDINLDEEKDQLTVEASKDKTQDIKNDLGVSVNDKVSTKIKLAILLSSHSQDIVFGLSYPNNYKLITQYIANSLANLNTLDEMIIKLSEINNPLINPFKEYLKLNKPATTLEEVNFRLEFFKAFNNNKKNFFQTNYQNTKEETSVSIVYQSDLGLSNSIKEKWKNNFTRKYNGIRFTKELVDNINNLLKSKKSDKVRSLELFKLLGIELNEATINIINNDDYLNKKEEIIHPDAYYFPSLSYSNFIRVFERTYSNILEKNKSEEDISNIISIFQKGSPLTYYIDAIANHQIIYETAIAEQSILNGNGDRVYGLQLNDFISNLFNKINYTLNKVANYSKENKNKELQKIVPELDSSLDKVFNLFVFNKLKGIKLKEIKIFNSSELVNLSNPTESISLSRQKPQDITINYFKSISFGHFPIPRAADRGYDTFISFIEKNGQNMFPINYSSNVEEMKKSFIEEMNNLLKYELYTRKKYLEIKESGVQLVYSGENQGFEDLRFFKNLSQTTKDKLFKININDIGDANLNSYPEIDQFIRSLIEEIYRDQRDLFINNELIKNNSLLIPNLIKEKNASTESTIYYLSLNHAVIQSQLFPLIFGDVAQFKNTEDIIKRIKLYNSTRQNVETSHLFEYLSIIDNKTNFEIDFKGENINVKLSKYESPRDKRFIGQVNYSRDKVISYITKDNNIELSQEEIDIINNNMLEYISNISGIEVDKLSEKVKTYVKNQVELYKKINSTDAFALTTLDFYRDLRYLSNNWQINDEISFRLQNKENLSDREKELINLGSFEILKTQGLGRLLNTELSDLKVISGYKHAIMPLVPQFIKGTSLEQLNEKLVKEGVDIIQTESANKFGTLLFGKGSLKLPDFPNLNNIKDISINNTQVTSISNFGIQQDTAPKPEDFVTAAKQFRGIVLNNLYKNGKLINENNKQKVDNYEDSQRELTDYLVAELLEKMGLSDETDINKFVDFIKNNAQVSDTNFLESLTQIKKGLPLEAIQNLGKVVSQILSEPRKATVNQKVPGMTGILASSTGFKITNKEVDSTLKRLRIENGRVLPGEIYITIPKAFESILENKYNNNLDELNKAIEKSVEAWYKDPNAKTEIPIELLQIIGFRIPNQAFSSNEYLIVTKFLPRNSGGVAIAYEEITLKTGSDFDVDKLTMYLPSFSFLNGKILITSNKDGKLSDETINLIVDQKINEIESVKNRKYRKAISTTILIRKQLKEELERKFGGFVDDELLADLEDFEKNKEKIRAKLFIDIKKQYLYNNLFFAQLDLITIPEQFGNFFNPVSDILLKGAVKALGKETPKFNYTELLKANHHIKLTLEFLEGKNLLGVVANAIRNHILSQKANIIGVNKVNKTLPLFLFNHNIQELSIIEGQTSQLTSYAGTTTKNNFPILSLLSEFLTAYVDIAKDSYIFRLNMTSIVINQVIAMIRAGVNMGDTINLMNQPIIDEYLKLTSFNESEFAKSNFLDKDNNDVIKEVFRSKGLSNYFDKSLYNYYKKNKTKEFTQKFLAYQKEIKENPRLFIDTNNKYYQSIILDIFLYQNLVSKPISNLSRIFKDDSIGFKSLDEINNQEQSFSELIAEGELLNLENLKYDSILSSFVTNNSIIKNKLANFYLVFSSEYINTYNDVVNTFKQKIGSDPARISRVVKDRIFDYIIQNYYSKVFPDDVLPINSSSKNNLFSKESGLFKEILEIIKPESTHPLKNNTVLNSFIIEDREVTMNLKQQNNNQIDTNKQLYIDSFNEIVKIEPQLADRIFKFAMLQSGKVNSDFNFIDIIPADMYYNKVVPIIDYFLQSKAMLNSEEIVKLIAKAHPELLPVLKRTSLVYIKELKRYQYLKDSVNFITFIEENKSKYPGIENYINNYKGFIKKLKQLNATVDNKLLVVTPIKTSDYKIYNSEVKVGYATVRQPIYNEKYTKIYKELQELREDKRENQERIKELEEIMKSATVINYSYKIYQAVYNYQLSTQEESIYDFIQIGNNSDGRYFVDMTASESISDISNFIPVEDITPTQLSTQGINLLGPKTKINIYAGTGENTELSNFASRPFKEEGDLSEFYKNETGNELTFNTVEGAYQAYKMFYSNAYSNEEKINLLNQFSKILGSQAKQLGGTIKGLDKKEWDKNSSLVMKDLLLESFEQNPDALSKLLATGNATLTHTQDKGKWGTEFPKLLMEVRDELRSTQPSSEGKASKVEVISPDYGVVKVKTNPTEADTQSVIDLISPQIEKQAYKENVGVNANWQFSFGNMWSRVNLKAKPLLINSFAGVNKVKAQIEELKKTGKLVDKSKYIYDYHELDQDGNPLPPISDLQPLINKIQNALGIDMSGYDSVLGNIYLDKQSIAPHRDTTEAKSAEGYPVIVYTIGNDSGLGIWDDNKGKMTFQGSYKEDFQGRKPTNEIATTNGTIYTFGMDGKGRFTLSHTTPLGNIKKNPFPPIKLSDGRVLTNYTITLTFRRAKDIEPGMPKTPAKLTTQPSNQAVVKPTIDTSREWKGDLESAPVYDKTNPKLVNTMRTSAAKPNEHFGNPFSEGGYAGTIKVGSIGEAVEAYRDWLLGKDAYVGDYRSGFVITTGKEEEVSATHIEDIKPEQRTWILNQINQGKLDKATLLYAGKSERRGQGMHPTALAEVVEELRSKQQSTQPSTQGVKPVVELTKEVKDVIYKSNLEKEDYEVVLVNGVQTFVNLTKMPKTIKKGYSIFYSDYLKGIGLIKRAGKKIVVPGFEDIELRLDQEDKSVIELSTGLAIPVQETTQSNIIAELENLFKTKNIRNVIEKAKKISANNPDVVISELIQPSTQGTVITDKTIEYTPKGKPRQTYTIKGNQIFNKNNKEVFKEASKDRNRIYANFDVQEGRAVVIDYKNKKYVVNNKNVIILVDTGDIMLDNNEDRISILNLAQEKFLKIQKITQPIVSPQDVTKDDIDIKKLKDFYISLTKEDQFKLGLLDELELDYLNKPDRNIDNYIESLKCKL